MSTTSPARATSIAAVELAAEPLRRVLALDTARFGSPLAWAMLVATGFHVVGAAQAYALASGTSRWARDLRLSVAAELRAEYEIDLLKPPPPPPPPPEPEEDRPDPTPAPKLSAPAPKAPSAPAQPPPAAAQAGKLLMQEPNPDEPVDLTGEGFVTGNAESFAGGVTANNGTSTAPVRNLNAQPDGVVGGTGKGPVQAPVPTEDRSRPCNSGATEWDCAFPPESDVDQIDHEVVPVVVTVRANGSVQSVRVVRDPGHGFGRAARDCAYRQRLTPGLDRSGQPTISSCSFNIRFTR